MTHSKQNLMFRAQCAVAFAGLACALAWPAAAAPVSIDGSDPATWDLSRDGVAAAPQNHRVLFENDEIRVLLVNVDGGHEEPYHLHRYWSVLLSISMQPKHIINRDASGQPAKGWKFQDLMTSPVWMAITPPTPLHSIKDIGSTPDRDIRVEFKHAAVPQVVRPQWSNGQMPASEDGSAPASWNPAADATKVAPKSHAVLFEDPDIRVQSVVVGAGAAEPAQTDPYPAVVISYGESAGGQFALVHVLAPQRLPAEHNGSGETQRSLRIDFKRGFPKDPT